MTMPNDMNAGSPAETRLGSEGESSSGGGARAQIRQVKDQVVDQARDSFRQARDSATSSLSQSRHQAADRVGSIASAFRSASDHLRAEHQAGVANLTDSLAEQVERLSSYLRDRDLGEFRNDLETLARRQPAVAIGAAVAVGMLVARFIKSSQQSGGGSRRFAGGAGGYDYDIDVPRSGGYMGTGPAGGYGMSSQPAGGGYGGA